MIWLLAFLIGVMAGLRSLTAPAVVAWAAHLRWLRPEGPLAVMSSTASVAIFTFLALGELIADKLPKTPSRTAPVGLTARIITGGLCGATIAVASGATPVFGALFGAAGGIAGAFGGYNVRTHLVKALGTRDFVVALLEDSVAIAGSCFIVSCI